MWGNLRRGGGLKIAKKRDLIFEQPLILTLVLEWIMNLVTFDAYAVLCSSALCLFFFCIQKLCNSVLPSNGDPQKSFASNRRRFLIRRLVKLIWPNKIWRGGYYNRFVIIEIYGYKQRHRYTDIYFISLKVLLFFIIALNKNINNLKHSQTNGQFIIGIEIANNKLSCNT